MLPSVSLLARDVPAAASCRVLPVRRGTRRNTCYRDLLHQITRRQVRLDFQLRGLCGLDLSPPAPQQTAPAREGEY